MDNELLRNEAKSLFDDRFGEPIVEELKKWYYDILMKNCRYVAFVVRRSYMLALIMEELIGQKMVDTEDKEYLTDAALILRCEEMSKIYLQTGYFPKIVLAEDTVLHGRGINHLIECLEKQLSLYLPDVPMNEIKTKLAQAIEIVMYVRYDGDLLLFGRYELRMKCVRYENYDFIHLLSDSISRIVSSSGMANASYIYSEEIRPRTFKNINLSDYVKTNYHNIIEYTKTDFITHGNDVKGICTIRLISDEYKKSYRAIPLIFVPDLDESKTDYIINYIRKTVEIKNEDLLSVYQEFIDLYTFEGKRSFNEALTLILSQAVLNDFNKENGIVPSQTDVNAELDKLARNYNQYGFNNTKMWLHAITQVPLLDLQDVKNIINTCVSDDDIIFSFNNQINYLNNDNWEKDIRNNIEDYFYRQGVEEEISAFELSKGLYYNTPLRSERAVEENGCILKRLLKDYDPARARFGVAYYLQMMDAGILTISSFAKNRENVKGFIQYAKAGELSLLTRVVRIFEYDVLFKKMQRHCWNHNLEFYNVLYIYLTEDAKHIDVEMKENILEYIRNLDKMGQSINDWPNNCLQRFDFKKDNPEFGDLIKLFNRQNEYAKCFEEYLVSE